MFGYFSVSFLYSLAKDGLAVLRRNKRKLTPSEIVALRQKWKPIFEANIYDKYSQKLHQDVIIRDMNRIDTYPDFDENKGISPWFRVGLVGTYHRGILVGMEWQALTKHDTDGKIWRLTNYAAGEKGDIKVALIGSIPYENIDNVDWDGDEYYRFPNIYCFFTRKKQPYEYIGTTQKEPIRAGFRFIQRLQPTSRCAVSAKSLASGELQRAPKTTLHTVSYRAVSVEQPPCPTPQRRGLSRNRLMRLNCVSARSKCHPPAN